ncbi:MAG: DNA polymerase III subunit chi [Alphaproteobacteria bacterium]|jgi:DNA polymerase-3 subunit chi|nr:DNA polymerase III subunit chi [Beijerinckiaceae bacterium]NBQ39341.1 DNA polymerase III subunit chi [Alphaproteobacteria bacterium]
MTDILFYHLERQPLEKVIPALLEKTLERGWRAVIRAKTAEKVQLLDEALWTYAEESFLPHAVVSEPFAEVEPIVITASMEEPNRPDILFLVEGAEFPEAVTSYQRVVLLFDGNDDAALADARKAWKEVRARGLDSTYWQQNENGRWEKKA